MRPVCPMSLAHCSSYRIIVASEQDLSSLTNEKYNTNTKEKDPLTQHVPYTLNQVSNPQST